MYRLDQSFDLLSASLKDEQLENDDGYSGEEATVVGDNGQVPVAQTKIGEEGPGECADQTEGEFVVNCIEQFEDRR